MSELGKAIADANEAHGIKGVQMGGRTITNDELREGVPVFMSPRERYERDWIEANRGRRVKRPRGRQVYVVRELAHVNIGYTITKVLCDREGRDRMLVDDRPAELSIKDIESMVDA